MLLLLLLEVAEAGAVHDRALSADGLGLEQQGVGDGRLAGPAVAAEQDVADVRGGVTGHGQCTPRTLAIVAKRWAAAPGEGGRRRGRKYRRALGPGKHSGTM